MLRRCYKMTITNNNIRYRRWAGLISLFMVLSLLSSNSFGVVTIIGVEGTIINADNNEDHATKSFTVKQNKERILPSNNNNHNFCGVGFQDASTSCKHPCPSGSIDECPAGMLCYFNTPCVIRDPTPKPTNVLPPKISPLSSENKAKLSFFCGKDWSDASNSCGVWCPDGEDDVCPPGQSCFGDTMCQKTTDRPTGPQPTIGPSFKPTDPTAAPSVGLMVDHPSNHQFCGYEYLQAINKCSLETHCPNGAADCEFPESCWHGLTGCDVRDFTPVELGGFMNRPTQQELAEGMGLSYPSDDPTDHFFCGVLLEDINKMCNTQPCPDGTATNCDYGQLCYKNTACDARIRPGYGVTQAPTMKPTPSPLASDAREYFNFCGEDWAQANTCEMQWCGDGSECPVGQSCFADTECNMKEKLDGPPTMKPTGKPVMYDDPMNTSFCGFSFQDAQSRCSVESHCPSGLQQECPTGEYCWVGTCNILEFAPPSPLPTQHPTRIQTGSPTSFPSSSPVKILTPQPQAAVPLTSSPTIPNVSESPTSRPGSESSNPDSFETTLTNRWCGHTRNEAYKNCGRPLYECPGGYCFHGLQCFVLSTYCENESAISDTASPRPTTPSLASPSPSNPLEQTLSPTFHPTQSKKTVFFPPISRDPIPKSPSENIERVQHIIESIESTLRSEIFVLITNGGAPITSSLYTYEGFHSALLFYSNAGMNDNYFYLGGEQSVDELINLEVEFGIANLALFIAKMMTDTIVHERCTPDLLACGLDAFDTTFETQQLRVMCPPSSDVEGIECKQGGVGCACTLGFLNKYIGAEGPASGKFSGLNFCSSVQSLCNHRSREGSLLRWMAAMTHWVLHMQRREDNGVTFIDELHKFVNGGMVDMNFLHVVADSSVLDTNAISRESSHTREKFVANFFKTMVKLSEVHSQSQTAAPIPAMQKTASPSIMVPSTAVPIMATIKPTKIKVPQTLQPTVFSVAFHQLTPSKLQSMAPSSGPPSKATESEAQPLCPTFCNEVVSIEECPSRDITVPFKIPYCQDSIGINEMCRGNNYCGTSASLNNCGKGRSVYRRIDCSPQTQTGADSVVDGGESNYPTATDTPCSLCRRGEIVIDTGIVLYNGRESTCVMIQSFLKQSVFAGDAICTSAQNELSAACCEAKTIEEPTTEADEESNEPSSAPLETIEPTQRGADLPWYVKYSEGHSSGGGGWQSYRLGGILICLLSLYHLH